MTTKKAVDQAAHPALKPRARRTPAKEMKPAHTVVQIPWVKVFVADDIRWEQNGKIFMVGLYADNVLLAGLPADAPGPTESAPLGMSGLSIMVTVGGIIGRHAVSVAVGKGKLIHHDVELKPGTHSNVILNLRPFVIGSFGVKPIKVEFAGQHFDFFLEVRRANVDSQQDIERISDRAL